jgi:hypothetical protein
MNPDLKKAFQIIYESIFHSAVYGLLNDSVSTSDYIASDDRMVNE